MNFKFKIVKVFAFVLLLAIGAASRPARGSKLNRELRQETNHT